MIERLLIFCLFICLGRSYSQVPALDSLNKIYASIKNDSLRIKTLIAITDIYLQQDLKKAESTIHKAISASKRIKSKYLQAETMGYMGYIKDALGELDSSFAYYNKAVEYCIEVKDEETYPVLLNNLASINQRKGKFNEAIDLQMRAVKVFEKNNDKKGMAYSYNNIGEMFWQLKQKQMAFKYVLLAQELADSIGYVLVSAYSANNLGSFYNFSDEYDKAIIQLEKAVKLYESIGDEAAKARSLQNIGSTYKNLKDFNKAIFYTHQAYDIYSRLNHKDGLVRCGYAIASVYHDQGNDAEALTWLNKTYKLAMEIKAVSHLPGVLRSLSEIYAKKKQFEKAYNYFVDFKNLKDSIFDLETTNKFQELEAQYQNDKKTLEIENLKTKEALSKVELDKQFSEIKKQNQQKIFFAIGFLFMLIIVFFVYRSYKQKQKDNLIITEQKHLVEEKQKEILDSIAYAKRLQEAILPPQNIVTKYLPDNFILYLPKDIVAGDFYWFEHLDNGSYIAAADSTGHGVPGAMVSVVCSNALNRAVHEFGLRVPGEILDKTRELVLETFAKSDKDVKDGMDISLVKITELPAEKSVPGRLVIPKGQTLKEVMSSQTKYKIEWAGANNPLWYYSQGTIHEIKAHKQPIGKTEQATPFPTHSLELSKGDELFLFTDGYADQFGGVKGKKFKYKQLEEVLLQSAQLSLLEQKQNLENKFHDWKGNLEQIDDVTIVGIRV
ncbi:MAG: tetratricopeptide repeat protein [Bacteroidetes bacterium]|nr:tetratricopeptide repeat protein [Bacteroidota bacterium]